MMGSTFDLPFQSTSIKEGNLEPSTSLLTRENQKHNLFPSRVKFVSETPSILEGTVDCSPRKDLLIEPHQSSAFSGSLGVQIISWNVAGLLSKLADSAWNAYVDQFDICIFQETWVTVPCFKSGYMCFSNNAIPSKSGRASGGLAIWVKLNSRFSAKSIAIDSPDIMGIKIIGLGNRPINIFNIYNRPYSGSRSSPIIDHLDNILTSDRRASCRERV